MSVFQEKEKKAAFREMTFFVLGCDFIKKILRLEKLILSQMRTKPSISTIDHVQEIKHML